MHWLLSILGRICDNVCACNTGRGAGRWCAGVDAECTLGTGCPPVRVRAKGLRGGSISISGAVSSQYLTALLMAAPLAEDEEVC
jgi:hypothetical protein